MHVFHHSLTRWPCQHRDEAKDHHLDGESLPPRYRLVIRKIPRTPTGPQRNKIQKLPRLRRIAPKSLLEILDRKVPIPSPQTSNTAEDVGKRSCRKDPSGRVKILE